MNVTVENVDKVSALLTVKIEKADYQERVEKALKSFRKNAQMPGFRKGMVPASLVKKMYGKSALAEEVNKLLGESVYKYIEENKLNILGEPLPNEDKQPEVNFDTQEDFTFLFDIALAPDFKAAASFSASRLVGAVTEMRRPSIITLTFQLPEGNCVAFGIFMGYLQCELHTKI